MNESGKDRIITGVSDYMSKKKKLNKYLTKSTYSTDRLFTIDFVSQKSHQAKIIFRHMTIHSDCVKERSQLIVLSWN